MPSAAQLAAFEQLRAQGAALRAQARVQTLGSLSTVQRAQLAQIVGNLAVSPAPNPAAAAAQIDALLTPAQRANVLTIEANARTQERTLMQNARAQFERSRGGEAPDGERRRAQDGTGYRRSAASRPAPDAGRTLLMESMAAIAPMGGHGPGGPGGPGPMGMMRVR